MLKFRQKVYLMYLVVRVDVALCAFLKVATRCFKILSVHALCSKIWKKCTFWWWCSGIIFFCRKILKLTFWHFFHSSPVSDSPKDWWIFFYCPSRTYPVIPYCDIFRHFFRSLGGCSLLFEYFSYPILLKWKMKVKRQQENINK